MSPLTPSATKNNTAPSRNASAIEHNPRRLNFWVHHVPGDEKKPAVRSSSTDFGRGGETTHGPLLLANGSGVVLESGLGVRPGVRPGVTNAGLKNITSLFKLEVELGFFRGEGRSRPMAVYMLCRAARLAQLRARAYNIGRVDGSPVPLYPASGLNFYGVVRWHVSGVLCAVWMC